MRPQFALWVEPQFRYTATVAIMQGLYAGLISNTQYLFADEMVARRGTSMASNVVAIMAPASEAVPNVHRYANEVVLEQSWLDFGKMACLHATWASPWQSSSHWAYTKIFADLVLPTQNRLHNGTLGAPACYSARPDDKFWHGLLEDRPDLCTDTIQSVICAMLSAIKRRSDKDHVDSCAANRYPVPGLVLFSQSNSQLSRLRQLVNANVRYIIARTPSYDSPSGERVWVLDSVQRDLTGLPLVRVGGEHFLCLANSGHTALFDSVDGAYNTGRALVLAERLQQRRARRVSTNRAMDMLQELIG